MDYRYPLIVVDQNVMRDADAIAAALDRCCRESLQLVIPDVAGFEFSKGAEPFDTWRRSLECLCKYPEFVSVSRKLTKMLAEEHRSGQACETLIDPALTRFLREMLSSLSADDPSPLRAMIDGPVRELVPESVEVWSDSDKHKQWIRVIHDELRRTMPDETLKRLRKNPRDELAAWLSSPAGIGFVFRGIKSRDTTDEAAVLLASTPSVSAEWFAAFGAVAVYWLAHGGLDEAAPEKFTNDLHDLEYAILGALSTDLLSKDRRLCAIWRAMSIASVERRAWFRRAMHKSAAAELTDGANQR